MTLSIRQGSAGLVSQLQVAPPNTRAMAAMPPYLKCFSWQDVINEHSVMV